MILKKHLFLSLLSLSIISSTGCGMFQSPQTAQRPEVKQFQLPPETQFVKIEPGKENTIDNKKPIVYVADLGGTKNGVKTGANVLVNITPPKNETFKTKGSVNGQNSKSIKTLRVNLTTDKNGPFTSKVDSSGFLISVTAAFDGTGTSGPSQAVMFTNVPVGGPYFATVQAYTQIISAPPPSGVSSGIILPDNNGTAYSVDSGATIATSVSSVTVNSDFSLTSLTALSVDAKIDTKGAQIQTDVTTTDTSIGSFGAS
jgi:hypothetical protein